MFSVYINLEMTDFSHAFPNNSFASDFVKHKNTFTHRHNKIIYSCMTFLQLYLQSQKQQFENQLLLIYSHSDCW